MSEFSKVIKPPAFAELRKMAESGDDNWWKDLLSLWKPNGSPAGETGLRLAVRDNYLNFYLRGQSVARVGFGRNSAPYVDTHVRYAFPASQQYARLMGTEINLNAAAKTAKYEGAETIQTWMRRAARHQGVEKQFVDNVAGQNGTVIDLEMGQPTWGEQKSALRVDLVALEQNAGKIQIVFWEAKRHSDKGLVAKAEPRIIGQLERYRKFIEQHRDLLVEEYRRCCEILRDLHQMAARLRPIEPLHELVAIVANGTEQLVVDLKPRLVIFEDKENPPPNWKKHEANLVEREVRFLKRDESDFALKSLGAPD